MISKIFGYIPSIIDHSVGEILLYFFVGFGILIFLYAFLGFLKPRGLRFSTVAMRIINFLLGLATVYALFVFGWGINFARQPLSVSMGYEQREYSVEELTLLCEDLAVMTNNARVMVSEQDGNFVIPQSPSAFLASASNIYAANAEEFMNLGVQTRVKYVSLNNMLSTFRIQGIFSPFTYEANVNAEMPDLFLPASTLHEYAHVQGFAREDECEFIAFYVGYNCGVAEFEYSSLNMALNYALNALSGEDADAYARIYESLHQGIIRDWVQHGEYWAQFDTPAAQASEQLNNSYLMFHNQDDGTKSYGRMLDLLLAMRSSGELVM